MSASPLRADVVVVTYGRPDQVRTCLQHLARQTTTPASVVVVDASPDRRTVDLVRDEFPGVTLLRNELGRGTTAESRQIGFAATSGDVIAFVDDDAYAEPDWLERLLVPYADDTVVGVGGRAPIIGVEGEESRGLGEIGRFLPNGLLTGNFGADPGRTIDVDHLLGANMSFRRSTLTAIGGIRGNYPGTCLCEESDISLRLRQAGGRLVYAPDAVVHHAAAPYGIGGARFDRRYLYYLRRNHVTMLVRVFGWRDPVLHRYVRTTLRQQKRYLWDARGHLLRYTRNGTKRTLRKKLKVFFPLSRAGAELAGLVAGVPAAVVAVGRDRRTARAA